ncbi:ESCRT-0 subunit protein hse1 [Coemansia sp. IMI 209127]|nr:ESCRT-0 subunit protein hse1 [Coemansia sp. IMI 209127]
MLTSENWELIMEVCDRVGNDNERATRCFEVINERLLHRNPNVVLYTLTLVQSLIENCGQNVKQEVASRAFTTTLTRVLNDKTVHEKAKSRILGYIQQWAFDFRQDPTLSLMEETYTKLRAQRFKFPSPQKPEKLPKAREIDKQKEEEDLQLALALSLSSVNNGQSAGRPNYQSPAEIRSEITRKQTIAAAAAAAGPGGGTARRTTRVGGGGSALEASGGPKRKVQVKALFDFTPTEDGELGFYKGDVIDVLDQKYRDWWKGELRGKSGIFPANFVQPLGDLRAEISKDIDVEVQVFSEAQSIETLLRMLGSIDPLKDDVSDNEEVQRLYSSTLALRPKIIKLIEKYNKKKDELVSLDSQLSKSMQLYYELMQRRVNQPPNYQGSYQQQQQQRPGQQPLQPTQMQPPVQQQPMRHPQAQQQQQPMQHPQAQQQQQQPMQHPQAQQQPQYVPYSGSTSMTFAQPGAVSMPPQQQVMYYQPQQQPQQMQPQQQQHQQQQAQQVQPQYQPTQQQMQPQYQPTQQGGASGYQG